MDEMTKKFNGLIEEIKSMFTVSQAMAKNSFDSTLQIPVEDETDNPDPLPDHEYPQQPKPTSLGNTIRHIADNIKSETDRNIIHQAADRLDAWWKYINELKEEVDLLKQQPTAGDFTKEFRQHLERERKSMGFAIWTQAKEACDRLDKETIEHLQIQQATEAQFNAKLDRAEAINKDLLEACETALPSLLCDAKDYASLNEGQASPFQTKAIIRIEAAIAKAKKEG